MKAFMVVVAALGFLTACAHVPPQRLTLVGCPRFDGQYVFDPDACKVSRGLLPLPDFARLPDGSVLPSEAALVGIHQQGCQRIGVSIRGARSDDSWSRRNFSIDITGDERESAWAGRVLESRVAERAQLPPPIAIGAGGAHYWKLLRNDSGDLTYVTGYSERGLFFLVPFSAHREVTCVLKAHLAK